MRRFVKGADRSQNTLFPESLKDWIDAFRLIPKVAVPKEDPVQGSVGFH